LPAISIHSTCAVLLGLGAAAPSIAAPLQGSPHDLEVLYSNIQSSPTSLIPGLGGVRFRLGGSKAFGPLFGTGNGHWITTGRANLDNSEDEFVFADGVVVQQEGAPANWLDGAANSLGSFQRVSINSSGDLLFEGRVPNSSGITLSHLPSFINGEWGFAAREDDPCPALPGTTYFSAFFQPQITDAGAVGFTTSLDGMIPGWASRVLLLDDEVLLQRRVTVPPGQVGSLPVVDIGSFQVSGDGEHWVTYAGLEGNVMSTVVIVDGAVVIQEEVVLEGAGYDEPVLRNGIGWANMDRAGHWYVRAEVEGSRDEFVLRDGHVIAATGQPVVAGEPALWKWTQALDNFHLHTGNARGDFVVAGFTVDDRGGPRVVLNGSVPVLEYGDPIDLDGNGLFDDGLFFERVQDDSAFLTDDLTLYAVIRLMGAPGVFGGSALVAIDLDGSLGEVYCSSEPNSTGQRASLRATGSVRVDDDLFRLTASAVPSGESVVFLASETQDFLPGAAGTSNGNLCLGGVIGRFKQPGQVTNSDASGTAELEVGLGQIRAGGMFASDIRGETWSFQAWFTDSVGVGSNFTDAVAVEFY